MIPKSLIWTATYMCLMAGLSACSQDASSELADAPLQDLSTQAECLAPDLQMNEVQSVGSHNSYKLAIPALEMTAFRRAAKEAADLLDYFHAPLAEQLDLGMRQLELDVFFDPEGGLYSDPYLPGAIPSIGRRYNVPDMDKPGFKTMHVQDVDQRSHCPLFIQCLEQIKTWSRMHPDHTPLLILVNAKQDKIELEDAVIPLAFTPEAFDALDAEIRSVFTEDALLTPDDVRAGAPTLREGVLQNGWPNYASNRGKIFFALDERPEVISVYERGRTSLEGHAMFVNSLSDVADHAAYFTINNPLKDADQIRKAVAAGFMVRTRADADTVEARTNDTARREAAFASGAQYISTDYYVPRKKFSDYSVSLPGDHVTRCRP